MIQNILSLNFLKTMKTDLLNEEHKVEDSTVAEEMAFIEKPFRETPITGFKKLFTSKTRQILK